MEASNESTETRILHYSMGDNARTNKYPLQSGTWSGILELLRDAGAKLEGKEGPAIAAPFEGGIRSSDNAVGFSLMLFDIENHALTIEALQDKLDGAKGVIYSTYNHGIEGPKWTPEHPRVRLLIPLERDITPAEYTEAFQGMMELLRPLATPDDCLSDNAKERASVVDAKTKDYGRLSYLPRRTAKGAVAEAFILELQGGFLNPDILIELGRDATPAKKAAKKASAFAGIEEQTLLPAVEAWRAILFAIDSSILNDMEWKTIIWAFGNDYGTTNEEAKALLVEWSKASDAHQWEGDAEVAFQAAWKRSEGKFTLATVVHIAKEHGYTGAIPNFGTEIVYTGDQNKLAKALIGADMREMVYTGGEFYTYSDETGGFSDRGKEVVKQYVIKGLEKTKKFKKKKLAPVVITNSLVRDVFSMVSIRAAKDNFFAEEKYGIAFSNGFLTIEGDQVALAPKSPANRCRFVLPFEYDVGAECPRFMQFLNEAHGHREDAEDVLNLLQEYVGALLFGLTTKRDKGAFLFGPRDTGKSVLCEIVDAMLPSEYVVSITPQKLGERFGRAGLQKARANIVTELSREPIKNLEAIKSIFSGDKTNVEQKNKDQKAVKLRCGHLFAANVLPDAPGAAGAFWKRVLVIPFDKAVPKEKVDRNLAANIAKHEAPGVVRWAAEGARRLEEQGEYTISASCEAAKRLWKVGASDIARYVDECLTPFHPDVPNNEGVLVSVLFANYMMWAKSKENLKSPGTQRAFSDALKALDHLERGYNKSGSWAWRVKINAREVPGARRPEDRAFLN